METKITTTEFARLMIASNARGAKKEQFSFTESDCRAVFGNAFVNEAMTIFKNKLIMYEGGVDRKCQGCPYLTGDNKRINVCFLLCEDVTPDSRCGDVKMTYGEKGGKE